MSNEIMYLNVMGIPLKLSVSVHEFITPCWEELMKQYAFFCQVRKRNKMAEVGIRPFMLEISTAIFKQSDRWKDKDKNAAMQRALQHFGLSWFEAWVKQYGGTSDGEGKSDS